MKKPITAGVLLTIVTASIVAAGQSGTGGTRATSREFGVNLTVAVYHYDETKSTAVEKITRLSGTFSSAGDEIAHIKDKYKLEDVVNRHIRSVGLKGAESFNDAVLMGPEYLTFAVTPREVVRGHMKLDLTVRYGDQLVLEAAAVEFENFETVMLRGAKGKFGLKYFVGAGGKQDSVQMERTLLVTVTPEIAPVTSLRNRPAELSSPVDEFGSPIRITDRDRFTPPVPIERAKPAFESGRAIRGSVLLGGVVAPDGKITNVRVLRALDPVIDERAVEALRQYKFSPAMLNGKPVHATYREEILFTPPPPSLLEIQEEQRRQMELEKEKQRRRRPRIPLPL
jgi:TonB family protein